MIKTSDATPEVEGAAMEVPLEKSYLLSGIVE